MVHFYVPISTIKSQVTGIILIKFTFMTSEKMSSTNTVFDVNLCSSLPCSLHI